MQDLESQRQRYTDLEWKSFIEEESMIDSSNLITFSYDYPNSDSIIVIETDEFTAVCPWTRLPDFGTITIRYVPYESCLELKSLKYYLLSYRDVGIVQEHAANRILNALAAVCKPKMMTLNLDYKTRGGLHTVVTVNYSDGEKLINTTA